MKLDYNYYYSERELENMHKKQQQRYDNYDEDDDDGEENYENTQNVENEDPHNESRNTAYYNNRSQGMIQNNEEEEEVNTQSHLNNLHNSSKKFINQSQSQNQSQLPYNYNNLSQNNMSDQEEYIKKSYQDMVNDSQGVDIKDFIEENTGNLTGNNAVNSSVNQGNVGFNSQGD